MWRLWLEEADEGCGCVGLVTVPTMPTVEGWRSERARVVALPILNLYFSVARYAPPPPDRLFACPTNYYVDELSPGRGAVESCSEILTQGAQYLVCYPKHMEFDDIRSHNPTNTSLRR